MSRWFGAGTAAVVMSIAALTAAGCGASGKTSTQAPAARTPAVPSTSSPTTATSGARVYPPVLKAAFLRGCERKSTAAKCECAITYLQAHVPLAQFVKDVQEEQATRKLPPGLQAAVTACKNR
jgi:hypothetical protein